MSRGHLCPTPGVGDVALDESCMSIRVAAVAERLLQAPSSYHPSMGSSSPGGQDLEELRRRLQSFKADTAVSILGKSQVSAHPFRFGCSLLSPSGLQARKNKGIHLPHLPLRSSHFYLA